MSSKKIKILLASLMSATLIATATSTVSWFITRQSVDTTGKMGGSVLQNYFNRGSGTKSDPFTITTPWHYENFVKLHYTVDDFADGGFYFQFGDTKDASGQPMPGSPASPVFYKTNENGIVDYSQTDTTLNLGGMNLPPLGTESKPFFGIVNGNNLTVKNFNVNGEGTNDVGIFGFVSSKTISEGQTQRAEISKCYWSDFIISTYKSAPSYFPHQKIESQHPEDVEVGYLAGHVVDAGSFTNCYVNRCKIDSKSPTGQTNNTYGYYGKAEIDSIGGKTGKGSNYEFHLDSESIYKAINENYASYNNAPIRTREEVDEQGNIRRYTEYQTPLASNPLQDPYTPDLPEIYTSGNQKGSAKYPLSSALNRNNGSTYTLAGKTPNNKTPAINYSLSTIGFQPLTSESHVTSYEAYYKDGSGNYVAPPDTDIQTTTTPLSQLKTKGDYFYFDNSNWNYIHSDNIAQPETEKDITFNLSVDSSKKYNFSIYTGGEPAYYDDNPFNAYVYIDNEQAFKTKVTANIKYTPGSLFSNAKYEISNLQLENNSFTRKMKIGKHYYACFIMMHFNNNVIKFVYLNNNDNALSRRGGTGANFNVSQTELIIDKTVYDAGSKTLPTFNTDSIERINAATDNNITYYPDGKAYDGWVPPIIPSTSFTSTLIGKNASGQDVALNDSAYKFNRTRGTEIDPTTGEEIDWYKWNASISSIEIDDTKPPVYIADSETITSSGYNWKNMDIVGGGVSFFYQNILGLNLRVISIPSERTGRYVVNQITESDVGKMFYSTKYLPSSIVMYVKNCVNAADDIDHLIGSVDFSYINSKISESSFINLEVPGFKKGNGNFVNINELGEITEGSGRFEIETQYKGEITESGAKKACYCALDKNGVILGTFNADGSIGIGFKKEDGSKDIEKLLKIDTYVIAIGAKAQTIFTNPSAWITYVNFKYTAKDGFGGTFGSVGYRDNPDTLENTILNFNYTSPENNVFSIKVSFSKKEPTTQDPYKGIYTITCESEQKITLNVFNYDYANYQISINGGPPQAQESITLEIGGTS